jgi:hypothetical protein
VLNMRARIRFQKIFLIVFALLSIWAIVTLWAGEPKITEIDLGSYVQATAQEYCRVQTGGQPYLDARGIMPLDQALIMYKRNYASGYNNLEKLYPKSGWLEKLPRPENLACPLPADISQ